MSEHTDRLVGEVSGKLDGLTQLVRDHIESHDRRHEIIDTQLTAQARDINQAKGAKTAIIWIAGGLATVVSAAVVAAAKVFGLH